MLFDGSAPRIVTIPASAPFLDTLVDALIAALPTDDPFALADSILFLPNRRASRGLLDAFARRLGGAALAPSIRPLGDIDEDPDIWGPDPLILDAPRAIEPMRRRFEIARLVRARDEAAGGAADPVRALALADELCRLLDAAATAGGVDWRKLDAVVEERDLAAHWRTSADFLAIVTTYWPQRLASESLADPAARKTLMVERLAAHWRKDPPRGAVVIAGSTGSAPATRALMAVVAALPKGAVVLPGLDRDLDDAAWAEIDAQHPQFALKITLETLGVERRDVPMLGAPLSARAAARHALMREALAPAAATADWRERLDRLGGARLIDDGAAGLTLLEAETEEEEAQAAALLLRQALEEKRTAALVTPDAGLARRVEAKLARWGAAASSSAGLRLSETDHGVLLANLAALLVDDGEPLSLLAWLKSPLTALPIDDQLAAIAEAERHCLRGARRWKDLATLTALTENRPRAVALFEACLVALEPLRRLDAEAPLSAVADALAEAAERSGGGAKVWAGDAGALAAQALRDAAEMGEALGRLRREDAPRALSLLLRGQEAPPRIGDPGIAIWGPLEARLQQRDLMVLGGLNEGVWPAPAPSDGFLSRSMRAALGLPEIEERVGLAAHDFAQLANAPNVVLTRARRRDGAPSVASRWIWRLTTLARAAERADILAPRPDQDPLCWARMLDRPRAPARLRPAAPKPPLAARPKSITFSRVETLLRDPYAIYARSILGLEALKPVGAEAGAAERGTAVHAALEAFADGGDPQTLLRLIEAALLAAGFTPARIRAERVRLRLAAKQFVAWSAERTGRGWRALREVKGVLELEGGFTLSGQADRIDLRPDGAADIIDYKTGDPPTGKQVLSGLSPQLTLEAAVIAAGGFVGAPAARPGSLIYWRFGGRRPDLHAVEFPAGEDAAMAAEEARARLTALMHAYASNPDQPYLSKPRAQFSRSYADYDHLARRAEWADAEGADE